MRPIDIVRKVCPGARASYLSALDSGDDLFANAGITTPARAAHFLAQCCHETGGFMVERESGAYSAKRLLEVFGKGVHSAAITPAEAKRLANDGPAIFERVYGLGNPQKAKELGNIKPGDGWTYRGGGILQTTGRANYRRMGQKCGVDFESKPELVLSAEHALKPALAEWTEGKLNAAADKDDIRAITRRINGGYNGLEDRKAWLAKIKALIAREGFELAALPKGKPPVAVPDEPAPTQPTAPENAPTDSPESLPTVRPAHRSKTVLGGILTWLSSVGVSIGGAFQYINNPWTFGAFLAVVVLASIGLYLVLSGRLELVKLVGRLSDDA